MHLCADEDKAREADASRATLAPIMRITSYVATRAIRKPGPGLSNR
ncbi:hypothetical protein [Variovorax sp. E3]|nr:hypothetical protein [Variovorax sp. E3]